MPMPFSGWLRLPSRIALLLGVGALSATGTNVAAAEPHLGKGLTRAPQQSAKSFGELRIWREGERIYISEDGKDAQELQLGDTPQMRHLRHLLETEGAITGSPSVVQHRMILVGGGGNAIHWGSAQQPNVPENARRSPRDSHASTRPGRGNAAERAGNGDNTNIVGAERQK
jgi:hypothetical protein